MKKLLSFFKNRIKARKLRIKNNQINKRINHFIKDTNDLNLPPREIILKPEIIIPCFNHGQYLEVALKSIPPGIPVTIIDDHSTDNSLSIMNELKSNYSFTLISNDTNLNQAGSLNKAISISINNLFIVLNADDALNNFTIQTIMSLYSFLPTIRLLGAGAIQFSTDDTLQFNDVLPDHLPYTPKYKLYNKEQARKYSKPNDINMAMSGCSFLKSAWESVGGFYPYEQRVCSFDDRDFQMRVSAMFDVAVIEEPLCFYRSNSSKGLGQQ